MTAVICAPVNAGRAKSASSIIGRDPRHCETTNATSSAAPPASIPRITPLDQPTMQKKENAALRLAVRTGNIDRARQAADRLFGLRLDAETQVSLAGQMRQLGMHEGAEAVLARARRQAGNRTSALISLPFLLY